ncbi:PhzF family phenazine biosynthesis protein [Aureimonas populi]|uniref:PhzF family phenazine biosynthesis protein n=1 Tax=Aureimonas populi TaxID=1701758 RepID=A0ABW5CKZ8_9HYPH|nr:PhzF family phenazine biosynthesis protein [Aureimonas populi]
MTTVPIYQADAFTSTLFGGNPAAVVPLEAWLPDEAMRAIALENNLSETAFLVPAGQARWELRWFTPAAEVPLCGHATLATALVLTECLGVNAATLTFATKYSGDLIVRRDGPFYEMRLPRRLFHPVAPDATVAAALGVEPTEYWAVPVPGDDVLMVVLPSEAHVRDLAPDLGAIKRLSWRSVLVTAKGEGSVDFVSRYFAPRFGIDEDPVTGSAHCSLAPLWMEKLGKAEFIARQLSARGGEIFCRVEEESVIVAGRGVLYMEGRIRLPSPAPSESRERA